MTMAGWIAAGVLPILAVLGVIATRRGWLRDSERPEDRVSSSALADVAKNRAASGTTL